MKKFGGPTFFFWCTVKVPLSYFFPKVSQAPSKCFSKWINWIISRIPRWIWKNLFLWSSYEFLAISVWIQSVEITVWESISRSHTASSHKDTWRLIWWGNYFFLFMLVKYLVKGLFVRNWKLRFMHISWWIMKEKGLLFFMIVWYREKSRIWFDMKYFAWYNPFKREKRIISLLSSIICNIFFCLFNFWGLGTECLYSHKSQKSVKCTSKEVL